MGLSNSSCLPAFVGGQSLRKKGYCDTKIMASRRAKKTLTGLLFLFCNTCCAPPNTPSPYYPFPDVLSKDQSLPANQVLPMDGMPKDIAKMQMMSAGQNRPSMPGMTPNMMPGGQANADLAGSTMMSMASNTMPPKMPAGMTNAMHVIQISNGMMPMQHNQTPQNLAGGLNIPMSPMPGINGMGSANDQMPFGPTNMPMPMKFGFASSIMMPPFMPADMAMMNLQMACQSLQMFVMNTPMAQEIFTSVNQMGNSGTYPSNSRCGYQAFADALRMFLKLCNTITSCPFPTMPEPIHASGQPGPLPVPYSPSPSSEKPKPVPPTPLSNIPNVAPQVPSMPKVPKMMIFPRWQQFFGFQMPSVGAQAGSNEQITTTPSSGGGGAGVSDD